MKFLLRCLVLMTFALAIVVLTRAPRAQVGTFTSDSNTPSLLVRSVQVREGNSGRAEATLELCLTAKPTHTTPIFYVTRGGTATPGVDYGAVDGVLNFAPGQNRAYLSFFVYGDTDIENNESVNVQFTSRAANAPSRPALVTILNDDRAPTTPSAWGR